jgi:flagellar biosynthetic protein FlhB
MSDDSSQEKTEEPTSKRLKDAREKGQTARSKDFNSTVVLLLSSISMISMGPMVFKKIGNEVSELLQFDPHILRDPNSIITLAKNFAFDIVSIVLPFLMIIVFSVIIGPMLIGGFNFSTKALAPKFNRMSPLKGIKKMFSLKSLMELVKSILKFFVVASFALIVWYVQIEDFLSISSLPISVAIPKAFHLLAWSFLIVSCSLILIAVIDVPFQLFDHSQQLKMTKQEVRDEYKETEGKPEVKSRIRRMQQEMAQNRMMAEVPKADVILTNPTHFAVALVYEQDGLTAPRVIAKGQDHMAIQIGKIAKAHEVPILRLPPLTRAIYYSTEIDQEIPRGLYIAVAQVLAYIFQLKTKDRLDDIEATPDALNDLPIPDDLKRDPKES